MFRRVADGNPEESWAGNLVSHPKAVQRPRNEEEIVQKVFGQSIRSFSSLRGPRAYAVNPPSCQKTVKSKNWLAKITRLWQDGLSKSPWKIAVAISGALT
jgi:hypothetical protein